MQQTTKNGGSKDRPGKIIAVGGAKGGIGKSLFVVNLSTLLSRMGKKVVLADLDLGAANLHLYMGVWSIPKRIDDFLSKRIPTIEEIVIPTKHGPKLIGGGAGKLGDANIHFSRKIKLMRALRTLDADYVILDLGGDTSYNILDFYLAADQGFVLTTCEPASYMDAYGFIKMSLQRKLTRLFGAESVYHANRDRQLEQIIQDHFFGGDAPQSRPIRDLLDRVRQDLPAQAGFINRIVKEFKPATVASMVRPKEQVDELISRLRNVSRKMLSIDLDYFGGLPFNDRVQQSAKDLVPHLARTQDSDFAKALKRIALKMEMAYAG